MLAYAYPKCKETSGKAVARKGPGPARARGRARRGAGGGGLGGSGLVCMGVFLCTRSICQGLSIHGGI